MPMNYNFELEDFQLFNLERGFSSLPQPTTEVRAELNTRTILARAATSPEFANSILSLAQQLSASQMASSNIQHSYLSQPTVTQPESTGIPVPITPASAAVANGSGIATTVSGVIGASAASPSSVDAVITESKIPQDTKSISTESKLQLTDSKDSKITEKTNMPVPTD